MREKMSEEIPVWRQALKDDQHPLHRAAWILFSKDINLNYVDRVLMDQKDEVVGFCNLILDTDELYDEVSLGSGNAPIHAVELLCHWKVESAIPRLLKIIDNEDWDSGIYGTTADAIAAFGTAIVDPLLEKAAQAENDEEEITAIAGTLADAAPGDPRVVEYVRKIFDSRKQDFEISYMSENVLWVIPKAGLNGCKIGCVLVNTVKIFVSGSKKILRILRLGSFKALSANRASRLSC